MFTLVRAVMMSLAITLAGCANGVFYVPDASDQSARFDHAVPHEEVHFLSGDGTRLHGWFLKAQGSARGTIVHLHGNAENLTSHVHYVDWLPAAGYNVLAFDYRGYGQSEGWPYRRGVFEDARAAYDYARSRGDVDAQRMILLGQSLGGANAIALAGRERLPGLKAVVAESAFSDYHRIAIEKMEQIPLLLGYALLPLSTVLVSDELSPEPVAGDIAPVPLLLITGEADQTVPASHSQRLYDAARPPKLIWRLPGAGHTQAFSRYLDEYRARLLGFFDYALDGSPSALDPRDRSALESQRQPDDTASRHPD